MCVNTYISWIYLYIYDVCVDIHSHTHTHTRWFKENLLSDIYIYIYIYEEVIKWCDIYKEFCVCVHIHISHEHTCIYYICLYTHMHTYTWTSAHLYWSFDDAQNYFATATKLPLWNKFLFVYLKFWDMNGDTISLADIWHCCFWCFLLELKKFPCVCPSAFLMI